MRYLLDTNVVIDILRDNSVVTERYQTETVKRNEMCICPVIYYEVARGFELGGATNRLKTFIQLYKSWTMLSFDEAVAKKAIDIYAQVHKQVIEDNDIYIASIAMANDCTLVTANVRHFSRVEGLNFVNWRTHD